MNTSFLRRTFVRTLLLSTLSACSTSPLPQLYIIEPMVVSAGTQVIDDLTITVGPITLPGHLDQKEIVTHDERYRVESAEFDRWAEPLDHNIARTISQNLSLLISSDQVIAYPPRTAHEVDYSVRVRIIEFGSNPDGQVVLNAAWMIHDSADVLVKFAKTRFSTPRRGEAVIDIVEAMSLAIEQLSRDIAHGIVEASGKSTE